MGTLRRFLANVARKAYTSLSAEQWAQTRRQVTATAALRTPYTQNAWVYAAATNKARALSAAPLIAVAGTRADQSGDQLPSTDPASQLVATPQPHPAVSSEAFVQSISVDLDTEGEAFALLYGIDGKWWVPGPRLPAQIVLVHPSRVFLMPTDIANTMTGAVRQWIVSDLFGRQFHVPAESVVHWMFRNPYDPTRGLSPLRACEYGIRSEWSADAFQESLLRNGASPGAVIEETVESGMQPAEREAFLAQFNDNHQSSPKAGKTVALPFGFKLTFAGQSPREMEMPKAREWSRSQIRAALGVTEFELGEISDQNRANAEASARWLWTNTLIPTAKYIEAVLWSAIFAPVSRGGMTDVWAKFDLQKVDALRGVNVEHAQSISTLVMAGFEPTAVAAEFGLDLPVAEEVGGIIDVVGSSAVQPTPGNAISLTGPTIDVGGPPATGGTIQIGKSTPNYKARRISDRTAMREHEALVEKSEALLAARVRAVFRDRHEAMRRALRVRKASQPPEFEGLLDAMGPPDEWAALMRESLGDSFVRIGAKSLANAARELGGFRVVKLDAPAWSKAADARVAQMVKVGLKTRHRIAQTIKTALHAEEGYSLAKLSDEIDRSFGRVIKSNGMVIARTETAMHTNAVRNGAFRDEGVEKKVWRAARDEHTRESHRRVDGEQKAFEDRFSNDLLYPAEPGGSPEEIIQCRCVARPRFVE